MIEVREPGGKLLSRHEFDNALTDDGADLLAQMFTRQRIAGRWMVVLGHTSGPFMPCVDNNGAVDDCHVLEPVIGPSPGHSGPEFFQNLTANVIVDPSGPDDVVLSGTATAGRDGEVDRVSTRLGTCDGGQSSFFPLPCRVDASPSGSPAITQTILGPPVTVPNAAIINVTVTFSFQ